MPVGVGAGQPRGDLGAIDRLRHHAQCVVERGEIEAREVEDLDDGRIAQQFFQVRRVVLAARDLDHVGGAVARRHLHHAQPVAVRIEAHGLGVDRRRTGVARKVLVRQVATVQADGHDVSASSNRLVTQNTVEMSNKRGAIRLKNLSNQRPERTRPGG